MKLSVLIITFNQARYIAQALESVLRQKTNFDFEIIVGDDCSTDGAQKILTDFQRRHPEKIKLLLSDKNAGAMRNLVRTYRACSGQYIALLEGDDLWITSDKLQKQADFLDRHPEFVMCFTNSRIVDENGAIKSESRLADDRKRNLKQLDIISGLVPPTNTAVFRNHIVTDIPKAFYKVSNGDIMLFSMLAAHGEAAYMDEVTGDYRIHGGGSWSGKSEADLLSNNLKVRLALLECFPKYKKILLPLINHFFSSLIMLHLKTRSPSIFFITAIRFILTDLKFFNFGFLTLPVQLICRSRPR